ncbi:hypothetical protein [Cohnella sp. GbtcB17]|uniref:hypothetical protein n=1 Tax=Cohnella sp. GbtcB17 TaxID=2824762 RepID=UPI001C2FA830|nr:hypothetical protein [Cohnella sp. GbtcB17]
MPAGHKPRIAAVITEYRRNSHAELIVGRLLGELGYEPQVQVAAMYTDQVPPNDMSREMAAKHSVPIFDTIEEAFTFGGSVDHADGLVLIGEHGDYPINAKGQKEYPRRRFIEEALHAMDRRNVRVPIFLDKQLAYDIDDACWIYEQIKRRDIPFLAGSSVPYTAVRPAYDRSLLGDLKEAFVVSWGGNESYGFHAMEVLQSLAERRAGGETGVDSVQALSGPEMWAAADRGGWPEDLLAMALQAQPQPHPNRVHPREACAAPVLFIVNYRDGTRGYVAQLQDYVSTWSYAVRLNSGQRIAAACELDTDRPFAHFGTLTRHIEHLILTGQAPCRVERTLFTTCMIDYAMASLFLRSAVPTPRLLLSYDP